MNTHDGYKKLTLDNTLVLLAGGGHKALSDFAMSDSYVKISGDTMTGILHMKALQYADTANTGALDLANSDIYGVNSIKFADLCDAAAEGLQWYRDATHIDTMWVKNGVMYFTPNREWNKTATNYVILHHGNVGLYTGGSGNLTANAALGTNGNVYLTLKAADTYFKHNIVGGGSVNVTSDANGKIIITGDTFPYHFNICNPSTENTWIQFATIATTAGDSTLRSIFFTLLFSNNECLEHSSFILTCAIRRTSTSQCSSDFIYTPLGTSLPKTIRLVSDDNKTFKCYIQCNASFYNGYYQVTKLGERITDSSDTTITYGSTLTNTEPTGSVLQKNAVRSYDSDTYATTIAVTDKSTHSSSAQSYWIPMVSTYNGNASVYGSTDFFMYRSSNANYLNIGKAGITSGITFHHVNESSGAYGDLVSSACTALRLWILPNASGTIALTSDIYNKTDSDARYVLKSGDTMTGALTIKGVADSGQYSQGGFNKAYANIILHGDNTYGVSGIVFKSVKSNNTNINSPSDVAFIQYHPYGVTAAAYNTTPTEATSGELGRLVIGIGNDTGATTGEELWLQTAGANDLKHYVVNTGYTIWDAGNDGSGSGLDADLLDGKHGSEYALSNHEHNYLNYVTGTTDANNALLKAKLRLFLIDSTNNGRAGLAGTNGFAASNNANSILWIGTHATNYGHLLGFSSNGSIYHRTYFDSSWSTWTTILNSANWSSFITLSALGGATSGHLHDDRYVKKTGDTMTGNLIWASGAPYIKMATDSSNAKAFYWTNTSNGPIAAIMYHNTALNLILNPCTNEVSDIWTDAVGKYSLFVGKNKFTYNACPVVLHKDMSNSDITGESGTFFFSGEGTLYSGEDYVGYQVGDAKDKWQMVSYASNLRWRLNDTGGTNSAKWNAFKTILDSDNSSVSGGGSTWGSSITVKINGTSKTLTVPSDPSGNFVKKTGDTMSGSLTIAANAGLTIVDPSNVHDAWLGWTTHNSVDYFFNYAYETKYWAMTFGTHPNAVTNGGLCFAGTDGSYNWGIGTLSPAYKFDVQGTGRYTGQLTLSVAQGTAPLAITSTTLCTNLNADLLDGLHSSSFMQNYNWGSQTINANSLTGSGAHRLSGSGSNFPVTNPNYGQMLTVFGGGDTVTQLYFPYDSSTAWLRSGNPLHSSGSGTWRAWRQIAFKDEIVSFSGTVNRFAYYNTTSSIASTSNISIMNSATNNVGAIQQGIRIGGQCYGNTASALRSGVAGNITYGDGGPQIIFSSGMDDNDDSMQSGAIIFTTHNSASYGGGYGFHFVGRGEVVTRNGSQVTLGDTAGVAVISDIFGVKDRMYFYKPNTGNNTGAIYLKYANSALSVTGPFMVSTGQYNGLRFINGSGLTVNTSNDKGITLINGYFRFTNADEWDYSKWAGLGYDSTNKIINLGIPGDGTVFQKNSAVNKDGTLKLVNIKYIKLDGASGDTYTVYHTGNLNLGNYVLKSGDTMTGDLTRKSSHNLAAANNGVSSTVYSTTFNIFDSQNRISARLENIVTTTTNGFYLYARSYDSSGTQRAQRGLKYQLTKPDSNNNVTGTWTVDDAALFRSAISVYSKAECDSKYVIDAGGLITSKIYDIATKRVFSGLNLADAPVTGWVSGLVLGSNWNNSHYQHYLVEGGDRWYTTRSYTNGSMNNWNTFAYLSDIPTKSSWDYDDRYVKKAGDTMTGTLQVPHVFTVYNGNSSTKQSAYMRFMRNGVDGNDYAALGWNGSNIRFCILGGDGNYTSERDALLIGYNGQLKLQASNGTAPITTSSTTLVTNLNADLLDDRNGAEYAMIGSLATDIANNIDLNNIVSAGTYTCQAGSIATTLGNTPYKGGNFRLWHIINTGTNGNANSQWSVQMLLAPNEARLFLRSHNQNAFGSWREFAFKDNTVTSIKVGNTSHNPSNGQIDLSDEYDRLDNKFDSYLPLSGGKTITGSVIMNNILYFSSDLNTGIQKSSNDLVIGNSSGNVQVNASGLLFNNKQVATYEGIPASWTQVTGSIPSSGTEQNHIKVARFKAGASGKQYLALTALFMTDETVGLTDKNSFLLHLLIRQEAGGQSAAATYELNIIPLGTRMPGNAYVVRVNNSGGNEYYVYIDNLKGYWTPYYALKPLMTRGNVLFMNVAETMPSTPVATSTIGGFVANATAAEKLSTACTLWGLSFDGTANVSGNMTGVGTIDAAGNIKITKDDGNFRVSSPSANEEYMFGASSSGYIYGSTNGRYMTFLDGKVGIGTSSPGNKLEVNGGSNGTVLKLSSTTTYSCINYKQSSGANWSAGSNSTSLFYFWNSTKNATVAYFDVNGALTCSGVVYKGLTNPGNYVFTCDGSYIAKSSLGGSSSGITISSVTLASTSYYPIMVTGTGSKTTAYIANPSSGAKFYATSSGVFFTSDAQLKTNISRYFVNREISENPVRKFDWKNGEGRNIVGFIAQEVEQWCPEAVNIDEFGYKSLNYNATLSALCGYLFDKVKELESTIKELRSLLNANKC